MKFYEFDEDEQIEQDGDCLLENEMDVLEVEYRCEDCDYRWTEKKKTYLSDENRTGTRVIIDDSSIVCPICGGMHISRV